MNALLADPATADGPDRDELLSMQGKLSDQRDALSALMDQKRQLEALHSQLADMGDGEDGGSGGNGNGNGNGNGGGDGGGGNDGGGGADSGGIEELLAGFMNVFQSDPTALSGLGQPSLPSQALDLGTNTNANVNTIEELPDDDAPAEQDETRRSPRVRFESPPSKGGAASSNTSSPSAGGGGGGDSGEGSIALPAQFANIPSHELLQAALQDDDLAAELVSAGLDPAVLGQLGEQQAELADLQRQLAEVRKLSALMDAQHAAGGDEIAAAITDGGGIEAMLEASSAEAAAGAASQAVVPAAAMTDSGDDAQGTEALQEQLAQLLHMRQHAESLAERFKELEQAEQNLPPGAELPQEDMLEALQLMDELKALRTEGTIAAATFADETADGAGQREDDQEWRRHRPPMPLSPPPEPPVSMSALLDQ